jgi:hypothetical protein
MATGLIAAIMSPRRGNRLAADALFAIDNNCGPRKSGLPGTACPGDERYLGLARSELTDSPSPSAARPGPVPDTPAVPGKPRGRWWPMAGSGQRVQVASWPGRVPVLR